ncbi:MAG: RhuM family protein [Candidatus Dojkabacteria bacterium]
MDKELIYFYEIDNKGISIDVRLEQDSIWLDQSKIALLFGVQRPAITKHIKNIFDDGELLSDSVSSKMEHTALDGKKYKTTYYNLDMIISVGYRVNSSQATRFRIWATNVLKRYLVEGYAINQKRLETNSQKWDLLKLQMQNLREVLDTKSLTNTQSKALIKVITDYTKALELIDQVDRKVIPQANLSNTDVTPLKYDQLLKEVNVLREELNAGPLFGQDIKGGLQSALNSIEQSIGGQVLYGSVESKAANLLYLIIKNHPFTDGNKRIGSFAFVRYLDVNGLLYRDNGTKRIEQDTLVAIALLIAQSNSRDKELMVDLVIYLIGME